MLNRPDISTAGLKVITSDPIPVANMMCGKPIDEVAETLPRLFNLCRNAHSVAIRLALGLDAREGDDLAGEIRDEHLLRLAIILPNRLSIDPVPFPRNDTDFLPDAIFGGPKFPAVPSAFDTFLESGVGIAPVLKEIQKRFQTNEACTSRLVPVSTEMILSVSALENSVAARHLSHPVLRHIERKYGRGPLWRVTARAIDLQHVLTGRLPEPKLIAPGLVVIPVARGLSAIRARTEAGLVADLTRITPTDHMLASGGMLMQTIRSLPVSKHDQAELLIDVLDPCVQVRLKGAKNA